MHRVVVIAFVAVVACSSLASAESPEWLVSQNAARIADTRSGMSILAGWAGVNLVAGLAASFATTGSWQAFHRMNAGWNVVNLAIAGFGLWSAAGQDPSTMTLVESLEAATGLERVLWLNVGLDVGYVVLGGWLWERGARTASSMLEGFGQSIVLQGAFLFAFDVAMSVMARGHVSKLVPKLAPLAEGTWGLVWAFAT